MVQSRIGTESDQDAECLNTKKHKSIFLSLRFAIGGIFILITQSTVVEPSLNLTPEVSLVRLQIVDTYTNKIDVTEKSITK
jgi:hypothetical protein